MPTEMSIARAELSSVAEQFPRFNEGGNLVFCLYANKGKLTSVLSSGIRPRGGRPELASFFPDVVSLSAIGIGDVHGITEVTADIFFALYTKTVFNPGEYATPPFYRYALVLKPAWVRENIQDLVGVGTNVCAERFRKYFRVNALEGLQLSQIEVNYQLEGPMPNEVHYKGGVLPTAAFAGVVHGGKMGNFVHSREFIGADLMLKEVLREVRQSGVALPTLADYFNDGELFDTI